MRTATSKIKHLIQSLANILGYRIVPRDRDPYTLLKLIESNSFSAVIDVGANNGMTCAHWLKKFPDAHVYAIEAQHSYLNDLKAIERQHPNRLTIWNFAASDKKEEIQFFIHEDHLSSSSTLQSTNISHDLLPFTRKTRIETVTALPIDDLIESANISLKSNTLLKLDVQGAELKVLKGAKKTLSSIQQIFCEINLQDLYEGQAKLIDILALLENYGFRLSGFSEQFHTEAGNAIYFDAVFSKTTSS